MTERSYIAVKAKVKTVCFVSRLSSMRYPKVYPAGQGQVPIAFGGKDVYTRRIGCEGATLKDTASHKSFSGCTNQFDSYNSN